MPRFAARSFAFPDRLAVELNRKILSGSHLPHTHPYIIPLMRLHHIALRVADCERSTAFYAGLLGLQELQRTETDGALQAVWLRAGDVVVMLERTLRGSGGASGSGHLLAFTVDDLAAWEARLAAAGVAIVDRSENTLYVQDPDGHRAGLSRFALP